MGIRVGETFILNGRRGRIPVEGGRIFWNGPNFGMHVTDPARSTLRVSQATVPRQFHDALWSKLPAFGEIEHMAFVGGDVTQGKRETAQHKVVDGGGAWYFAIGGCN